MGIQGNVKEKTQTLPYVPCLSKGSQRLLQCRSQKREMPSSSSPINHQALSIPILNISQSTHFSPSILSYLLRLLQNSFLPLGSASAAVKGFHIPPWHPSCSIIATGGGGHSCTGQPNTGGRRSSSKLR